MVAHGKLPTTLFRPPIPHHARITPEGKFLEFLDAPPSFLSKFNSPSSPLNCVYGDSQAGLAQKVYRKQPSLTDSLARNQKDHLAWGLKNLSVSPNSKVLEANCGTAIFSRYLLPNVKSVTVSDVSRHMIQFAKEKESKLETVVADTNELPFPDESFDIVISRFALNQFQDISIPLRELARVVKNGGHVAIIERVPHPDVVEYRHRLDFLENVRDESHVTFYTPQEICEQLAKVFLTPAKKSTIFGENATDAIQVFQDLEPYLSLTRTINQNRMILTQAIESNANYPDGGPINQVSGFQPFFEDGKLFITETHAMIVASKR